METQQRSQSQSVDGCANVTQCYAEQNPDGRGTTISSQKVRLQINSCLICNDIFFVEPPQFCDNGKTVLEKVCRILQVRMAGSWNRETNPLCRSCVNMTQDFFRLEKQIQELISTLKQVREWLAKKVVTSYAMTVSTRKNYVIKTDVYNAWISKLGIGASPNLTAEQQPLPEPLAATQPMRFTSHENDSNTVPCLSPTIPADSPDHNFEDCDVDDNGVNQVVNEHDLNESAWTNSQPLQAGNQEAEDIRSSSAIKTSKPYRGKGDYQCRFCGRLCATNFALEMHVRIHTGEKPFSCSVCGRKFSVKCNRDKHERIYNNSLRQPQFQCDQCERKYFIASSLEAHKLKHLKGTARIISYKSKRYPVEKPKLRPLKEAKKSVKKAIRRTNAGSKNKEAAINYESNLPEDAIKDVVDNDGSANMSIPRLQRPRVRVGRSQTVRKRLGRPVTKRKDCEQCGKVFRTAFELTLHTRIHTGETPYECQICHRRFARPENKFKHMAIHNTSRFQGEKRHMCDICGKKFYLQHSLYSHKRRVHHGIVQSKCGPVPCPICGKVLRRREKLKPHMLRHTNEKNFCCEVCGRPFFTSREARAHAAYHNPNRLLRVYFKHKCPECPSEYFGYPSKGAVMQHWLKAHPNKEVPVEFHQRLSLKRRGHFECQECPEGNRPVYQHNESLRRHRKKHHIDSMAKSQKAFKLTRPNVKIKEEVDSELSSSESSCSESSSSESSMDKQTSDDGAKTSKVLRRCSRNMFKKQQTKKVVIVVKRNCSRSDYCQGSVNASMVCKELRINVIRLEDDETVTDLYNKALQKNPEM